MSTLPACPKCQSAYTYEDGERLVYPACGHDENLFPQKAFKRLLVEFGEART
ncbi:MAG: hypothetical protein QM732_03830 [Roseateles sp.]